MKNLLKEVMEINNRKSVNDELRKYCLFAKDNDFIEITEWTNGEGWDITISGEYRNTIISLTVGELEAINYLVKSLDYQE